MRNFDFAKIKEAYDKADKGFNPTRHKVDNKDPNPRAYTSKLYFKFLAINNKTITKALKSTNAEYYKAIVDTNGDYSRRKGGNLPEQIRAHVDWARDMIGRDATLKYSILGVFCDTYDLLNDLRWRAAFKLAFDYCRRNGDNKTIVAAIKSLYFALVISCETTFMKVIEAEYYVSLGNTPVNAVLNVHEKYYTFMKKNILPTINVITLLRNTKDPITYVKSYINGENKAKRATENFSVPMYKDEATKSAEGVIFDTMKASGGAIANIAASGLTSGFGIASVIGSAKAGAALAIGSNPVGWILAIVGSLWFIITLIPSIRIIIYYAMISKTNVQKELKLHSEILGNNIAMLKEKYDNMSPGAEKDKLGEVIKKQQSMYEDLLAKMKNETSGNYNDDAAVDSELDGDESDADKEAEDKGNDVDDNNDGNSDDDFSVLI